MEEPTLKDFIELGKTVARLRSGKGTMPYPELVEHLCTLDKWCNYLSDWRNGLEAVILSQADPEGVKLLKNSGIEINFENMPSQSMARFN